MTLTSQMCSLTCVTPTFWPANTVVPTGNLVRGLYIEDLASAW